MDDFDWGGGRNSDSGGTADCGSSGCQDFSSQQASDWYDAQVQQMNQQLTYQGMYQQNRGW